MADIITILIFGVAMVGLFILFSVMMIIAIGWTHYPYGFKKNKHRRNHHE